MNPINEAGCLTFLRALERNEDSKLHYLNLWVNKNVQTANMCMLRLEIAIQIFFTSIIA